MLWHAESEKKKWTRKNVLICAVQFQHPLAWICFLLFKFKMKGFPKRDKPRSNMCAFKNRAGKVPPMTSQVPSVQLFLFANLWNQCFDFPEGLYQRLVIRQHDTKNSILADIHSCLFDLWLVKVFCRACINYYSPFHNKVSTHQHLLIARIVLGSNDSTMEKKLCTIHGITLPGKWHFLSGWNLRSLKADFLVPQFSFNLSSIAELLKFLFLKLV